MFIHVCWEGQQCSWTGRVSGQAAQLRAGRCLAPKVPIPWVGEFLINMVSAQQQAWWGTRWAVPGQWPEPLPSLPYASREQVSDSHNFNGLWYSQQWKEFLSNAFFIRLAGKPI